MRSVSAQGKPNVDIVTDHVCSGRERVIGTLVVAVVVCHLCLPQCFTLPLSTLIP